MVVGSLLIVVFVEICAVFDRLGGAEGSISTVREIVMFSPVVKVVVTKISLVPEGVLQSAEGAHIQNPEVN